MNNRGKKIEVNSSSLLELKAELFRKEEEFKQAKIKRENGIHVPKTKSGKKPNIWAKQNIGVLERAQQDIEEKKEEEDALEKSKKALEAKAKLYEKMSKQLQGNEEESLYLVDFDRKILNAEKEKRTNTKEAQVQSSTDDKEDALQKEDIPASCPEEDWVDFVDCLGRSRRCLRKDLPRYLEIDKDLKRRDGNKETEGEWKRDNDLLSQDMAREIERKDWEEEETAALDKPVGPVHFQNVENNEIRDYGVGYFAFAKDELERGQQMGMLHNLRKQTENQRTAREKLKERRKALLQARLEKIKQRKKAKLGLEASDEESDANSTDKEETKETETQEETPEVPEAAAVASVSAIPRKPKVRPWDVGKVSEPVYKSQQPEKRKMSAMQWIETERSKRVDEFAPPQFYFDTTGSADYRNHNRSQQQQQKKLWNQYPKSNSGRKFGIPSSNEASSASIDSLLAYYKNNT